MKKHFLIGTTIVAIVLSFGLLFYSVYAALTQSFSINNKIHFAGSQNIKFILNGNVTGTTNDLDDRLKLMVDGQEGWHYDYETQGPEGSSLEWTLPDITIKSEDLTLEQIHLTYTFTIQNQSECEITAAFDGPGDLASGLIKTTYVQVGNGAETVGSSVQVPLSTTATLKLKLTLESLEGFSGQELINFSILINAVNG